MKNTDPRELLNQVIRLMAKDVQQMEDSSRFTAEPGAFSADLTRYTTALLAISKDTDQIKDDAKRAYQKMTTEELVALARQAADTLKPQEGTSIP